MSKSTTRLQRLLHRKPQTPGILPNASFRPSFSKDKAPSNSKYPRDDSYPPQKYSPPKYGDGPTPCYICGSGQTRGYSALRRKRTNMLFVVPTAYPTRICAQRYHPRPEARIHTAQIMPAIRASHDFFLRTCLIQTCRTRTRKRQKRQKKNIIWKRQEMQTYIARMFM